MYKITFHICVSVNNLIAINFPNLKFSCIFVNQFKQAITVCCNINPVAQGINSSSVQ